MSTPHTPGPWEIRHESTDPEWAVVVATGGRIVANVNAETGPDIPPLVSTKMPRDANARLIAAAPDLLEALQRTVEALEYWLPRHGDPEGANSAMMVNARATIAKATSDKNPSTPTDPQPH